MKADTLATFGGSPTTFDFGDVPVNTKATAAINFAVDAGYSVAAASGTGINVPFSFSFGACGVGGGFEGPGNCTINETFDAAIFGITQATLTVFECSIASGSCLTGDVLLTANTISLFAAHSNPTDFGDVVVNTEVTKTIGYTVDTGYSLLLASGSGINRPFSFDFGACGGDDGFSGPGDCAINETFHPTTLGAASGTLTVYECPIVGGSCLTADDTVMGNAVAATAVPEPGSFFSLLTGLGLVGWRLKRRV